MQNALVLLVAATLSAGCAGGTEATPGSASSVGAPTFDQSTGAIDGVVTDESLAPLRDVQVFIDPDSNTTSDQEGHFAFSRIAPGPHAVQALALGYESKVTQVNVAAGETTKVTLVMEALPVVEPYFVSNHKSGQVMCGLYVRPQPGAIGACVLVDQFKTTWTWPNLKGMTGFMIETTWRSTQAAGNGLELYVPFLMGATSYNYILNVHGPTPIRASQTREEADSFLNSKSVKGGIENCDTKSCGLDIWHYVYGTTLGPSSPADFGVLVQQAYTDYVTIFYNMEIPEKFTALPDT